MKAAGMVGGLIHYNGNPERACLRASIWTRATTARRRSSTSGRNDIPIARATPASTGMTTGSASPAIDRIEITASTQAPYMDRDEIAIVMRLRPEAVRIVPTACGGGFGGKLDLSVQPDRKSVV